MNLDEYKCECRIRFRRILVDVATGAASSLLAAVLASAARLLF